MAILNGFLRGAHDKEITANVDNKEYSGVATEIINWIGTKRGGLSKRAPFKLHQVLDSETKIIPYNYDDDEKYLLLFSEQDDKTIYKIKQYIGGVLIDAEFGGNVYQQPNFTSNEQDGYIISGSVAQPVITDTSWYKAFNKDSYLSSTQIRAWLEITFPNPILITDIDYVNGSNSRSYSGWFKTTVLTITDEQGGTVQRTVSNTDPESTTPPVSGTVRIKTHITENFGGVFAKKLKLVFSDTRQWSGATGRVDFGSIIITGQMPSSGGGVQDSPITFEQLDRVRYYNAWRRMWFVSHDFSPYELQLKFTQPTYQGLDFISLGNPSLVGVFQDRLCFSGFENRPRQMNLSKTQDYSLFTLNTTNTISTDPIEGTIGDMKSPISALFTSRQLVYAQSMDGLGTLSSGGDEVPLTPTQIAAGLRNATPLSKDIEPVRQDQLIFCVGADNKTVYALDYDYQMARVPLNPLNEHCITLFDSGIKQMKSVYGRLPFLVFLLNDGTLIVAIAYKTDRGFMFHAFPQSHASGKIQSIEVLAHMETGYDTLFATVLLPNGVRTLESIESYTDNYSQDKGLDYFREHLLLDSQQGINPDIRTDITFTYTGNISTTGRMEFNVDGFVPELPDKEIKIFVGGKDIICKNCDFSDDNKMWAECSEEPIQEASSGYVIPSRIIYNNEYAGLKAQLFDGDDFLDIEEVESSNLYAWGTGIGSGMGSVEVARTFTKSPNPVIGDMVYEYDFTSEKIRYKGDKVFSHNSGANDIVISRFGGSTETLYRNSDADKIGEIGLAVNRAVYGGVIGLPYKARAVFENLTDANSVQYEKEIENISACITYGTGLKLGTESVLEKVGFWNYPFKDWQDRILPDENLKNIPLADTARKDKKIVVECDYPFPANVTFVVYDLKITGVR